MNEECQCMPPRSARCSSASGLLPALCSAVAALTRVVSDSRSKNPVKDFRNGDDPRLIALGRAKTSRLTTVASARARIDLVVDVDVRDVFHRPAASEVHVWGGELKLLSPTEAEVRRHLHC